MIFHIHLSLFQNDYIEINLNMEPVLIQIYLDVLHGDHKAVIIAVKSAIKQGIPVVSIMNDGMITAMAEVGRLFEIGEYYVPEMLVAARAMQTGMRILKPFLTDTDIHPAGKVAIGTVQGDYHDIGKNLVKMMLEGAGFEVIDLGVDVSPATFTSIVIKEHVDILAMSALITTTMVNMRPVIEGLEKSNLRQQVKVLVGGAPLTEEFAQQIGADGYAPDASRAVTIAKLLLLNHHSTSL
jgi:5-methyltetrahydrofolate--homocysteine methyltransferase